MILHYFQTPSSAPSANATPLSLWGKLTRYIKDSNGMKLVARTPMLTLAHGEMETIKMLPDKFSDLEIVAKNWVKPAPGASFSLRVPVHLASPQASRYIQGDYIWLNDDESYQLARKGVHALYVEVVSDNPPPPPPPPPPVLEMPATFKLELNPGQLIELETACESFELDMSRTEDGTIVDGLFTGKLDIFHDFDAKVHKMEFTGKRFTGDSDLSDLVFDSRMMSKLAIAAKPTPAKCNITIVPPRKEYCDVTLVFSSMWELGTSWPPAELMPNNKATFFVHAHPGGAMEHFGSETVVTALYYEAIPNLSAIDPAQVIAPYNSFAMTPRDFIPHIGKVLETLKLSIYARTSFVNNMVSNVNSYKTIAYRFMPPSRLSAGIALTVSYSPCVMNRIFLVYRGISDDESTAWAQAGVKEAAEFNWKDLVGLTETSRDEEVFRVLETAVFELS